LKTKAKPQGFIYRLGYAESPAEARRWGALQGTPPERPEVDFAFEFVFVFRLGHPNGFDFSIRKVYPKLSSQLLPA
jgi:hypothetical protein